MNSLTHLKPDWQHDRVASRILQDWLTLLKSPQPPLRREALERIRTIPAPNQALVHEVGMAVGDPDQQVRLTAIAVLQGWGTVAIAASTNLLSELEHGDSLRVRSAAATALGVVNPDWKKDPSGIELKNCAIQRLQDKSAEVRRLGVEISERLTAENPDERLELLLRCLGDPDEQVYRMAKHALNEGQTLWRDDPHLAQQVTLWRKQLIESGPELRVAAVRALGEAGPAAAVAFNELIAATDDQESKVRVVAVNVLSSFKAELPASDQARDALIRRLADASTMYAARQTLDTRWPTWRQSNAAKQEVETLVGYLATKDGKERQDAVVALGVLGSAARPAIVPLLKLSLDSPFQHAVWNALGRHRSEMEQFAGGSRRDRVVKQ